MREVDFTCTIPPVVPAPKVVIVLSVTIRSPDVFDAAPRFVTPDVAVIVDENVVAFAMVMVLVFVPIVTTFDPESPMVMPAPAPLIVADATERNVAAPVFDTLHEFDVPFMSLPVPAFVT